MRWAREPVRPARPLSRRGAAAQERRRRRAPIDMIFLYRRPILDYWCETGEELAAVVRHVLIHEIGHHFGFSDDDMERIESAGRNPQSRACTRARSARHSSGALGVEPRIALLQARVRQLGWGSGTISGRWARQALTALAHPAPSRRL